MNNRHTEDRSREVFWLFFYAWLDRPTMVWKFFVLATDQPDKRSMIESKGGGENAELLKFSELFLI
jgi:hypothetical protein